MKRLITAILAILYMGTSLGATLNMHFCMDKLAAWNLTFSKSATCPSCGMEKSIVKGKSCCSDKQLTIKTSTDQKAAENFFQATYLIDATLPVAVLEAPQVYLVSITEANPVGNAPPKAGTVAIYIRNRNFRI